MRWAPVSNKNKAEERNPQLENTRRKTNKKKRNLVGLFIFFVVLKKSTTRHDCEKD